MATGMITVRTEVGEVSAPFDTGRVSELEDLTARLILAKGAAKDLPMAVGRALLAAGNAEVYDARFGGIWEISARFVRTNNTPLPGTMPIIGIEGA